MPHCLKRKSVIEALLSNDCSFNGIYATPSKWFMKAMDLLPALWRYWPKFNEQLSTWIDLVWGQNINKSVISSEGWIVIGSKDVNASLNNSMEPADVIELAYQ